MERNESATAYYIALYLLESQIVDLSNVVNRSDEIRASDHQIPAPRPAVRSEY